MPVVLNTWEWLEEEYGSRGGIISAVRFTGIHVTST
jgi:hypothetical protein